MPLFDRYVMVDWSASSVPKTGRDSIWIGISDGSETTVENIPTRAQAIDRLIAIARGAIADGHKVLMGFDFPFGYPAGTAEILTGEANALALWDWLSDRIEDGPDNANNRFEVARDINAMFAGKGPFWGRPETVDVTEVPTKAKSRFGFGHPPDRRLAERSAKGAKTVWQLAYAGAVGSQVLMGLPALNCLRKTPDLTAHMRVWPFETGLSKPEATVVLAEIYPSLIPPDANEAIKDAGQVRAVAEWLSGLDRDGVLPSLFEGPRAASPEDRVRIEREEAWILGLGAPALRTVKAVPPQKPHRSLPYERNPAEIYRKSFDIVRAEANLDHLPSDLHPVATRLVHACGMPDITNRLAWSDDIAQSARTALGAGASVLCDCESVHSMVIRHRLPAENPVRVTLNDTRTAARSQSIGNTRSAAAIEFWEDWIDGAVVAIGNAPTALFHLLELIDLGWPKPAAILGFPVGFVGAAESKAELAAHPRGIPFLTLRGRRGGSAMAAAAVNALAAGLETP